MLNKSRSIQTYMFALILKTQGIQRAYVHREEKQESLRLSEQNEFCKIVVIFRSLVLVWRTYKVGLSYMEFMFALASKYTVKRFPEQKLI